MNYLKLSPLILLLFSLTIISCSDDDSPRDFRLALEGDYEVDDIELTFTVEGDDTTYTDFDIDPEITLEIDAELDADEMAIDLEEFLEDLMEGVVLRLAGPINVSIDFDDEDDLVVEVSSSGEFETDDIEFEALLTIPGEEPVIWVSEIQLSGEIIEEEMSFEYFTTVMADGDVGTLEGEGTATKQ